MPLSIDDAADFELLQQIEDEPKSSTQALADTLEVDVRSVASRLAWMARMGLIERTIAQRWILTSKGRELIDGRAGDLMAVRELSRRAKRSKTVAWVTAREFRRNIG